MYLQNDYIIKPEFLEWQVFFNAFYSNNKTGNGSNNAVNIGHIGKGVKTLDLEFDIPIREIDSIELNTNVEFNILKPINPNISFSGFNTRILNIQTPKLFTF